MPVHCEVVEVRNVADAVAYLCSSGQHAMLPKAAPRDTSFAVNGHESRIKQHKVELHALTSAVGCNIVTHWEVPFNGAEYQPQFHSARLASGKGFSIRQIPQSKRTQFQTAHWGL